MAAILITTLVVTFAMGAYIQISDTAQGATLRLRDDLHSATILDRVAADLESTMLLVKPEEVDPLRHPWYFVAESRASFGGSDALRFIGRRTRSYTGDEHTSDFAQIAYQVETDDEGLQTLHRWLLPGLPQEYDPGFPALDDERNHVLGEGLSGFTLRFSSGDGEWIDSWDSTQLTESSLLPAVVEIAFDMGTVDEEASAETGPRYQRRVILPLQAIDLAGMISAAQELVAPGSSDDDDDEEGEDDGSFRACVMAFCVNNPQTAAIGCALLDSGELGDLDNLDDAMRSQVSAATGCN